MILVTLISCRQNQIKLDELKINQNIAQIGVGLRQDADPIYGFNSYFTDELDKFKIFGVQLSKYRYPNNVMSDYSNIYLYVDNFKNNNFLGLRLNLVKDKESNEIIKAISNLYGQPLYKKIDSNDDAKVWYDKKEKKHIFLIIDKQTENFKGFELIIAKDDIRIENSNDPKTNKLFDQIKMLYLQ